MTIYQNNVPQANDIVSESQSDFQFNHISENAFYGFDHKRFNDPDNPGKHAKVTYFDQNDGAGGGQPTTTNDEIALYAYRNDNVITNPYRVNLRARYQNNVATEDIGIAPFAAAYFGFIGTAAPTFLSYFGPVLNIDQAVSARTGANSILLQFLTPAANTDYFVMAQIESSDVASAVDVIPQVTVKTVNSFRLQVPSAMPFATQRISFNVFEN